jgi:anaerobic selenocysteine-containing dehydrogenase
VYWTEFRDGAKTREYRRWGRRFNAEKFKAGRTVFLAYNYQWARYPLLQTTVRFCMERTVEDCMLAWGEDMTETYPDMKPADSVCVIGLAVDKEWPAGALNPFRWNVGEGDLGAGD